MDQTSIGKFVRSATRGRKTSLDLHPEAPPTNSCVLPTTFSTHGPSGNISITGNNNTNLFGCNVTYASNKQSDQLHLNRSEVPTSNGSEAPTKSGERRARKRLESKSSAADKEDGFMQSVVLFVVLLIVGIFVVAIIIAMPHSPTVNYDADINHNPTKIHHISCPSSLCSRTETLEKIPTFLNTLNQSGELDDLFSLVIKKLPPRPRLPFLAKFMRYVTGGEIKRCNQVLLDADAQKLCYHIIMHLHNMNNRSGERWCDVIERSQRPCDTSTVFGVYLMERFNVTICDGENDKKKSQDYHLSGDKPGADVPSTSFQPAKVVQPQLETPLGKNNEIRGGMMEEATNKSALQNQRLVDKLQQSGMQPKSTSYYILSLQKLGRILHFNRKNSSFLEVTTTNFKKTASDEEEFSASFYPATIRRE